MKHAAWVLVVFWRTVVVAGMEQKQYGAGEGWDGVRGGAGKIS